MSFARFSNNQHNPIKIVSLVNTRALGDAIYYHIYAASVRNMFDNASLCIYQRPDREYKTCLLEMNTHADQSIVIDDSKYGITLDSFCGLGEFTVMGENLPDYLCNNVDWYRSGNNFPDIILSPGGMSYMNLPWFEHPAFLRIPDRRVEQLAAELQDCGVDPSKWFCVINYREPGYQYRPARRFRDLDPKPFMALAEDIIENLGGQVVRVGHPRMTAFPERPGFIDLAPLENGFWLHAFAVTRARFMMGSLSGISHLGSAVNTPTVITNCTDSVYMPGCWRDHDLALYMSLFDAQGRRISVPEQHEAGYHDRGKLTDLLDNQRYTLRENTPAELGAAARRMMEATSNCKGWREPHTPGPTGTRPNKFEVPLPLRLRVPIMDYTEPTRDA